MKEIESPLESFEKTPGTVEVPSDAETHYWVVWEQLFGLEAIDFQTLSERERFSYGQVLAQAAITVGGERGMVRKPHWLRRKNWRDVWQEMEQYCDAKRSAGTFLTEAAQLIRSECASQEGSLRKRLVLLRQCRDCDVEALFQRQQGQVGCFLDWLTKDVPQVPRETRWYRGMMAELGEEPADF